MAMETVLLQTASYMLMKSIQAASIVQPLVWSRISLAEVATVTPSVSQLLVTPSISEPRTEPTETNCGRAMELKVAR